MDFIAVGKGPVKGLPLGANMTLEKLLNVAMTRNQISGMIIIAMSTILITPRLPAVGALQPHAARTLAVKNA